MDSKTKTKEITLILPIKLYEKLKKEETLYSYNSIQDIINEVLRDKYLKSSALCKGKRGRPKKIREDKILARKKIFDKDGVAIQI